MESYEDLHNEQEEKSGLTKGFCRVIMDYVIGGNEFPTMKPLDK